jgi:endoglucanase
VKCKSVRRPTGGILVLLCILATGNWAGSAAAQSTIHPAPPGMSAGIPFDPHILADQFGYRPQDPKVAVIRNPQVGFDSSDQIVPGPRYEVRQASDGGVVFSGTLTSWNGGLRETSSGDTGWWFDFSAIAKPGTYFIYDAARNVRSAAFRIDAFVYRDVLKAAVRTYFYQRSGFAKQQPYAEKCWTDALAYSGANQDIEARDITDRRNKAKTRNMSGGWFDAGDTTKYVTFAGPAVHQVLTAYQATPAVFTDDFNIPESGNGVPDLLDEVKWELDWLGRMQFPDGSVALKVGDIIDTKGGAPSADDSARYYVPACTSATIAAAGMFAHAAYVFREIGPLAAEAHKLRTRAVAAWKNYQASPNKQTACDSGEVRSAKADWSEADQNQAAVVASVYLFAITGDRTYGEYVKSHYRETRPYRDIGWSRYNADQGEALLFYTALPDADPALKQSIAADKLKDVKDGNQIYGFKPDDDLYRAFMPDAQYHWGSNGPRANYGNSNLDALIYRLTPEQPATYQTRALEILHYFHGVNPFTMVYLSNMYRYGATRSANAIYHAWFWHGSKWGDALTSECGPAPGFVPGGPNASAAQAGVPTALAPPTGQPPQKSYKDWNVAWPDSSWAVTEPAIYYQASYIRLLSYFAQ